MKIIHAILLISPLLLATHWVGEPELEKSQVWKTCCERDDCIVQDVEVFGHAMQDEILTSIDGEEVLLNQDKFHVAPTSHTWVCYFTEVRKVTPENIRCILYPQNLPLT